MTQDNTITDQQRRALPAVVSSENRGVSSDPKSPVQNSYSLRKNTIALTLCGSTILGTIALTAPFVFSRSSLPYMATPGTKVRRALQYLLNHHLNDKKTSLLHPTTYHHNNSLKIFVDMGSGDGEALYQASHFPYDKITGLELNYTLYLVSQLRRLLTWPHQYRQRTQILLQDMFDYNLATADTIMIFGINPLMPRISQKIADECKPGTYVLAYRFKMPLQNTPGDGKVKGDLIYNHEEMRIYKTR